MLGLEPYLDVDVYSKSRMTPLFVYTVGLTKRTHARIDRYEGATNGLGDLSARLADVMHLHANS